MRKRSSILQKAGTVVRYLEEFGLNSPAILFRLAVVPDGRIAKVPLPGARGPLRLRKGTTDENVFMQVFLDRQYADVFDIEPRRIIDCGAHIGCAALYFALRYPRAEIVCVEPSPDNFALLTANTAPYPNIRCIHGALSAHSGPLRIVDSGQTYSYRVESDSNGAVRGYTMPEIMASAGWDSADLVKIDIEGSEREIFAAPCSWIGQVRVLTVELHDGLAPGCSAAFYRALLSTSFAQHVCGENVVIRLL